MQTPTEPPSGGFLLGNSRRPQTTITYYGGEDIDVELVSIRSASQIGLTDGETILALNTYDWQSFTVFSRNFNINMLEVIQAQLGYIDSIRNDPEIVIPPTVDASDLVKLNEPVIKEIRARRIQ